ncbi:MAG: bifunctional diaminohydroxyphosphoribosylaminopyrimidine deaminase/5-amino-6-(5-phosphoribosylamino)uracil reductase RibD [Deltaproteobacteria bacterium]|nr:bifunctional diaminohydroxyphosphoribosylaminopyrimidine deaminase/5-amino-6-(5-phosphoribosylamino)uracil reductase RibD [Deltaproteobacteria bacterium]
MTLALQEASLHIGRTAPNPPVGATALGAGGILLATGAHEQPGTPHAEVVVLDRCRAENIQVDTLVVTLEPCNHFGRTPPCTDAIIAAGVRRVIYGVRDPNPRVAGGGIEKLLAHGIVVEQIDASKRDECDILIQPFRKRITTGRPFVTVKTAHLPGGSMIPPFGRKTFTSPASIRFAHELRKRSDAIITGSGTVLADDPLFTVRAVADHPDKKRLLVIFDRRKRITPAWEAAASSRGFEIIRHDDIEAALDDLGSRGCLEVLVEGGPSLAQSFLLQGLWDRHVRIEQGRSALEPDIIRTVLPTAGTETAPAASV